MADKTSPKLVLSNPSPNAQKVAVSQNIVLTFDEAIKAGTGYITITNGKSPKKIKISDTTQVTIKDKVLTVNPKTDLALGSHYSVTIDNKAIADLSGNLYAGIKSATELSFDTLVADKTPPKLQNSIPATNEKNVKVNQDIVLTFDEPIKAGIGYITINDGKSSQKIKVSDTSQVTIKNNVLTVNPKADLALNSHYSLTIDNKAVKDLAGNVFLGITDNKTLSFDTVGIPVDTKPPELESSFPKLAQTKVTASQNLVLTFNENIKAGSGIIKVSNGTDVREIDITDKTQVSIKSKVLTVNPKSDLVANSRYSIIVEDTAITDLAGNAFIGINSTDVLYFDTKPQGIDKTSPNPVASNPTAGAKDVDVSQNIILTFNELIKIGTGNVVLSNGKTSLRIPVTDKNQVSINGQDVIINPSKDLDVSSIYTLTLDSGAIKDTSDNNVYDLKKLFPLSFTTGETKNDIPPSDTTPPKIDAFLPKDDSVDVAQNADFILKFNEPIMIGKGFITISDGAKDIRKIDIKDKQITIDQNQLMINPMLNLKADTAYFIKIDKGAIQDLTGNDFLGILDEKSFNFKTGSFALTTGFVIDDYIADATVSIQGTDGVIYNVKTDNFGHFSFPKGTPVLPMMISGGKDIGTGLDFKGKLSAPAGSSVVTPLTTLQQTLIERGQTPEQAQATITKAFGVDSKINIMTYDPIDGVKFSTSSTKNSALTALAINTKIVNLLTMASDILQNSATTTLSLNDANDLVVKSLLDNIDKAKDKKVDLNSSTFLKNVFVGATTVNKDIKFDSTKVGLADDVLAKVMADTSANIDAAINDTTADSATAILGNVSRVSNFNQSIITTSISDALRDPTTFDENLLLESLTGSAADDAIKNVQLPSDFPVGTTTSTSTGTPALTPTPAGTTTPTPTPTGTLTPITLTLSDTGAAGDNITSNGQIDISNLIGGRIWEYTINGVKQTGSGSSISVTGDGDKLVTVSQTDAKNNLKTASFTFKLDTTPPVVPTLSRKDADISVSTESGASWQYKTNTDDWKTGTGSSFSVSGSGSWSVLVRQIDAAGNISSNAKLEFVLAAGILGTPMLSLAADTGKSPTDNITNNGQINVANLASGTIWQYSLDNQTSWTTGSGSNFTVSGDGSKSVIVKQTLNGKDATSVAFSFTLDKTAPTTPTLTLDSDTGSNKSDNVTNSGLVKVANLDSGTNWQYSTDNGKNWVNGGGSSFTLTGDGLKSVIVKQTDVAGNSTTSVPLIFTLDATAPATPILSLDQDTGNPTDNITSNGKVNVTKLETGATWKYNGENVGSGSNFTVTGDGNKSVLVKQTDIAGNESDEGKLSFTLKTVQPSAPKISLAFDTGNSSDKITSNGQVNVIVESGESWQYRIDQSLTTWIKGSGSSFVVAGSDGEKKVLVQKIDASGAESTPSVLDFKLTTATPTTPFIDSVTGDGQVNVSGMSSDAIWQYSLDLGSVWNVGSGSSFKITGDGSKTLRVRQTDGAGNTSNNASLDFSFKAGTYFGTPQDVASNLASLERQANTLSGITLISSSSSKISLILSKTQLLANQNALSRINGTTQSGSFQIELEQKSELTAKEMADLLPSVGAKVKSNSITIKDSAQSVQVYWDQLHMLNIDPPIGAIYFTDKVKPKLSLSLSQYDNEQLLENSEQSGLLKFIKSPYSLVVYDVQTNDAITQALDSSISSISITDTAAAISTNFSNLINVYNIGKLNSIVVTDNQALDVSQYKDLPKFSQVMSKVSWLSTMSDFQNDYTNSAVSLITVKDSAQAVQENIDLLQSSIKKILTLELIDDSIPTITLSQLQYQNDLAVLNKISTAHEFTIIAGLPNTTSSVTLVSEIQMRFNGTPSSLSLSGNTPITISYDITTADEVLEVLHFGEDADKLLFKNINNDTIEMLDTQINGQVATWLHSSSDNNHGIILAGVRAEHLTINNGLVTLI